MATERIEISYEPLSNTDYPKFHHSFFIYRDKNGKKYFLRGGPNESSKTYPIISDKLFGIKNQFKVEHGECKPGSADYPKDEEEYPSEIIKKGNDLSKKWDDMVNSANKYNNGKYGYDAYKQNCNTLTGTVLRENRLPEPKYNGYTGYWTPSFNNNMNDNIKPESPFDPFSYPYNPDNDGTTNPNPLDEYGNPLINPQLYDPLALDLDGDGWFHS